jgi:hypothetical protein
MFRTTAVIFFVVLGLTASGVSSARADAIRFPATGTPAYAFDLPSGWSATKDDYGNMRVAADDKESALLLSFIVDPSVATATAPEVAAKIIKAAGAAPYTRSEPGSIAGIPGETFITTMSNDKGVVIDMRLVLVKLDSSHYASLAILAARGISASSKAALDALVTQVRFAGHPGK